jgi:hypothetical protein
MTNENESEGRFLRHVADALVDANVAPRVTVDRLVTLATEGGEEEIETSIRLDDLDAEMRARGDEWDAAYAATRESETPSDPNTR